MQEKLRKKFSQEDDDGFENSQSPEFGPKKGSKYDQLSASKYSSQSSDLRKLSASRGISTDDSVNGEKTDKFMDNSNKIKTFTARQWLKVIKNNDLENTSVNELVQSLRYGVPDEL